MSGSRSDLQRVGPLYASDLAGESSEMVLHRRETLPHRAHMSGICKRLGTELVQQRSQPHQPAVGRSYGARHLGQLVILSLVIHV